MELRKFTDADAEAVSAIRAETINQLTEFYDRPALEAWAGSIHPDDFIHSARDYDRWVAVEDGRVVGYADWKPSTKEFAGIYVDPSMQRRGIGSAIFARIEQDARDAGAMRLWANVTKNARGFYEKHGFIEEGEGYYQADEYRIRTLMMGKRLE